MQYQSSYSFESCSSVVLSVFFSIFSCIQDCLSEIKSSQISQAEENVANFLFGKMCYESFLEIVPESFLEIVPNMIRTNIKIHECKSR